MKKINEFKTRVLQENKVYLLVSDAAKVLGYDDIKTFTNEHTDMIKKIERLPLLISEEDFNSLLAEDPDALKRLKHLEFTKVETLRSSTESIKSLAPLKYIFAKTLLEYKVISGGYSNIEECLETELEEETSKEKEKIKNSRSMIENLKKEQEDLEKLIDRTVLEKHGLIIQNYTRIENGRIRIENFIVGKGIFFSLFTSDYAFDLLTVLKNGDLLIPTYDESTNSFNNAKNYGHDPEMRDFRKYSCLENIRYIIQNRYLEDAGVDLLECNIPGINFFISQTETIKLLTPNLYRELMMFEGIPDFEAEIYKTIEK